MGIDTLIKQMEDGENIMSAGLTKEAISKIRKISNMKERVTAILKLIHDPEIPVNVWDLGLIYNIDFSNDKKEIYIKMTLTSPTCPVAEYIPLEVKKRIQQTITGAKVEVELVWEPSWDDSMMTEEAKCILDMM